jgi:hypothetical protein
MSQSSGDTRRLISTASTNGARKIACALNATATPHHISIAALRRSIAAATASTQAEVQKPSHCP